MIFDQEQRESSEVYKIYSQLVSSGVSSKEAAIEAQRKTGVSLVTGRPIKSEQLGLTKTGLKYGDTRVKSKLNYRGIYS